MIDVVGHFGSHLSYATVSDQVVRGLMSLDALGNLTNLDDKFLDESLAAHPQRERSKNVILLADPRDYLIEAMVGEYGRSNVAIFVCPNTDLLSDERARACHSVDLIYTPSRWCANTIFSTGYSPNERLGVVNVMPLGVDDAFATRWIDRHVDGREDERIRLLHVTTDTFWGGRKGTEELLHAWKIARELFSAQRHAHLTVHCLPQLYATIHQELGDLDLVDDVELVSAPLRGTHSDELYALIASHDMLVAPSRSEGFGIMPLSALVSGTPVLMTAGTGQDQYVGDGSLDGWVQIPTFGHGALSGEDGGAPMVRCEQLAFTLAAGWSMYEPTLLRLVEGNKSAQAEWSWKTRRAAWAKSLIEWAGSS